MSGGSSREDPVHSHEQIPQRGYGDGQGNYGPKGKSYGHAAYYAGKGGKGYATHYAPPSSPYGYAPDGQWAYGYGPLHHFSEDRCREVFGYGPMHGNPSATYGGKGRGQAGKSTYGGSQSPDRRGKGKGSHIDHAIQQDREQELREGSAIRHDPYSSAPSQRSSQQQQGTGHFATRRLRREEASRSRSQQPPPASVPVVVLDAEDLLTSDVEEMEDVDPGLPATPARTPSESPSESPSRFTRIGFGIDMKNDAKLIQANMEAVQTLIIALKGRTDEYSMRCRQGLEVDLHALRVRKTKLKPLEDQNAILEALVEKRTTHFSQSEHNVQAAISEMEAAKQSLMVAQQQLLQVRVMKAEADAKSTAMKEEEQKAAEMPNNLKSVQKLQDLVCLLPNGMADGFGQCLKMLETLLLQANASTVTYASNVEVESVCSGISGLEQIYVPVFPGGDRPLHEASSSEEVPATAERSKTPPPRGRARSAEPERSPVTRSRTHSLSDRPGYRGKSESMEEAFSRGGPRPHAPP